MKRLKILLSLCPLTMGLFSCNKQIIDFDNHFERVHIYSVNKCVAISTWNDYDGDQIQVKTSEGDVWLFHSSSIILVHGDCPICGHAD